MQTMISNIESEASKLGLMLNCAKCKFIRCCTGSITLCVNGTQIACCDSFCYLGSLINGEGDSATEIRTRIAKAWVALNNLKRLWNSKVRNKIKLRVFNAAVIPVVMYGSETWCQKKSDVRALTIFQYRALRSALNISALTRISHTTQTCLLIMIKSVLRIE